MNADKNMKIYRLPAILFFALAAILAFGACGGKQSKGDGLSKQERKEQKAAEAEMTPEELEALRQEKLDEDVDAAIEEYLASNTSEGRDYKTIEKQLKSVLKERPDDGDVMFNLGVLAYEQGDVEGAVDWWNKATDSSDTYTRGMANLGMLKLADGDVDGANAIFEDCVERSQTAPGT